MHRALGVTASALALLAGAQVVQAQSGLGTLGDSFSMDREAVRNEPILFAADQVSFDTENNFVRAWGGVEINQAGRTVRADELYFDAKNQELRARGNVFLIDKSGSRLTADEVALDSDFTRGFISQVQMKLAPEVRIAATYAERRSKADLDLYQGILSPCPACKDNPDKAPLWQIKAGQIHLDGNREMVFYKNARIEVMGVPIFYIPFAAHADPRRERQSGWLIPDLQFGTKEGFGLTGRYYLDIADSTDATVSITPYFGRYWSEINQPNAGTNGFGGARADLEFRQAIPRGMITLNAHALAEMEGSYFDVNHFDSTDPAQNFGGDLEVNWSVTDNVRLRGKGYVWTDREFYSELDIDSAEVLSDEAELEGFFGRSYTQLYGESNRPTRSGMVDGQYPLFGRATADVLTEPFWGGVTAHANLDLRHIQREAGRDYSRASLATSLRAPFTLPGGQRLLAEVGAVGALYQVSETDSSSVLETSPTNPDFTGDLARIQPHASLTWSLPLTKRGAGVDQVIEPIVSLVYAGEDGNTGKIPNEDSLSFELGESNLFDPFRTTGIDFSDAGARVNYGLKYTVENADALAVSAFIGQSYSITEDSGLLAATRTNGSGIEEQMSHLIGGLTWKFDDLFSGNWQARYDVEDGKFYRNDVNATLSFGRLDLTGGYEYYRADDATARLERASIDGTLRFTDNWSVSAGYSDDLAVNYANSIRAGIAFNHPCLDFGINGERTYDINGKPDDSIGFTLGISFLTQTLGSGVGTTLNSQ